MKAVLYKWSTVIHTSKHGEVCVVILEVLKINCMGIKICQDPALFFCHKTSIFSFKNTFEGYQILCYLFAELDSEPLSEFFFYKLEQYVSL